MARLIKYSPTSNGTMVPDRKGNWYFAEEVAPLLVVKKLTSANTQSTKRKKKVKE
jgi:hypothetical protein